MQDSGNLPVGLSVNDPVISLVRSSWLSVTSPRGLQDTAHEEQLSFAVHLKGILPNSAFARSSLSQYTFQVTSYLCNSV